MDLSDYEQQLQAQIDEIRRSSKELARSMGRVRGRGEVRGVAVEVDAAGEITNLQIAPGAMRWVNSQLADVILDCHRRARNDAKTKVKNLLSEADPRIRSEFQQLFEPGKGPKLERDRPRTEEEIQAADDAYFERMNRGWNLGER